MKMLLSNTGWVENPIIGITVCMTSFNKNDYLLTINNHDYFIISQVKLSYILEGQMLIDLVLRFCMMI